MYNWVMSFEWDPDKNEWLKRERNISFEEIIFHLAQGDIWRVSKHPDQNRYPGQQINFVVVEDYVYLVPFVETDNYKFLKTVIPSRKATKMYLSEKDT